MKALEVFLAGKGFTYAILALYTLRAASYGWSGNWSRLMYWVCALGITVSAEFLVGKDGR